MPRTTSAPGFVDTVPLQADEPDPYIAGLAAQLRELEAARSAGVEPKPEALDSAFWSAYRESAFGDLQ
jgi:hypothetical protein